MLVQSTSNLVTMNERLASQLWQTYMALPDEANNLMSAAASVLVLTMRSPYIV